MARIRSIKPEFWTSAQVLECSANARLLFIGMWNFCDDAGRHPDSVKQLKAEIFPADEMTLAEIEEMVDELSSNDLIMRYVVEGKGFIQVKGWHHQRIDKAQKPKHPAPINDGSSNVRGSLPPDRKGEDRIGEEGIGGEEGARQAHAAPTAKQPRVDSPEPISQPDDRPDKPAKPKRARALNPAELVADLPGLSPEVARDYLDHRRAKGSRLTPTAWKQIAAEVAQCRDSPDDCLAEAMAAGWQGFKAEWYAKRKRGDGGPPGRRQPVTIDGRSGKAEAEEPWVPPELRQTAGGER